MRDVAGRYPAALPLLLTRPATSPGAMRVGDTAYRALLAAGVPPEQVPRLERMLSTFVIGHPLSEISGRFGDGTLDPRERREQLPPEGLPGHHALADRLDQPVDWDDEFRTDLRDLCDLVAARAASSKGGIDAVRP